MKYSGRCEDDFNAHASTASSRLAAAMVSCTVWPPPPLTTSCDGVTPMNLATDRGEIIFLQAAIL